MFKHRLPALLMTLVLGLSLLAGCGSKPAEPTTKEAPPAQAPPQPIELQVWTAYPEIETLLKAIGADYTKENPNVTVKVTLFAQRAMDDKMATALPAGQAADVFDFGTVSLHPYHVGGYVEPVPQDIVDEMKKSWTKAAVEAATDKNQVFIVPSFVGLQALFYNKDHFAEVGLTNPPQTMDELMNYAKKLTKYDAGGKVTRAGYGLRKAGGGYGTAEKFWALGMIPFGVDPLKQQGSGWVTDLSGMEKGLQWYLEALYTQKIDSFEVKGDAEGFAAGTISMFQRESWVVGNLKQNAPNLKYGVALMPKGDKGWGTPAIFSGFGVPKSSKHKAEAWKFIKFATNQKNQVKLLAESGWVPVRIDTDYSSVYASNPVLQDFVKALNTPGYQIRTYPLVPAAQEVVGKMADILMPAFQKSELAKDAAGVTKVVSQVQEQSNKILKDNGLAPK